MENNTVINIENIGKTYQLGKIGSSTLQARVQSWLALRRGKEDPNQRIGMAIRENETFEALKNVSCQIKKGERVGIIGANGAGKSTLLKLLSRVTAPTTGKIVVRGRISSMLEVGTGFHGELTGRENIYLNGAILGMKQSEVDEKIQEIIEFSECEKFIDTPVKRYSSGMYVRLAFSVAAHLNADIFLMDEVLAVGDMQFQKKCLNKMKEISEDGERTILYVSHQMQTIRELCNRCIVLSHGEIIHDGSVDEGIRLYMKNILEVRNVYEFTGLENRRFTTGNVQMQKIALENPILGKAERFLKFHMYFHSVHAFSGYHVRFTVHDSDDQVIGTGLSESFASEAGDGRVSLTFDTEALVKGEYSVDLAIVEPQGDYQTRHAWLERGIAFRIEEWDRLYHTGWVHKKWGSVRFADLKAE